MIPVSILFVLMLCSTANAQSGIDQLVKAFQSANGLVTSILSLINSIITVVQNFAKHPQLTSLFTTLAAVSNSTNATETCAQTERDNFVTLLSNTSTTIGQCFNSYGQNAQTAISTTMNLFNSLGDVIMNVTDQTAACAEEGSSLLEIPICFLTQVTSMGTRLSQIINEITAEVQITIGVIGNVINNMSICVQTIVETFIKNLFIVLSTFTSCLSQIGN